MNKGSIAAGLGLSFGCQLATAAISMLLSKDVSPVFTYGLLYWGVFHWIFVIPVALLFRSQGRTATVKGMIILSSIVLLLNSLCGALVFKMFGGKLY